MGKQRKTQENRRKHEEKGETMGLGKQGETWENRGKHGKPQENRGKQMKT